MAQTQIEKAEKAYLLTLREMQKKLKNKNYIDSMEEDIRKCIILLHSIKNWLE